MRKVRIGGDEQVSSRSQNSQGEFRPNLEILVQVLALLGRENCETRQWRPLAPSYSGRNSPNPAVPVPQFCLLSFREFQNPKGRVGNNRMKRVFLLVRQPLKAISVDDIVHG